MKGAADILIFLNMCRQFSEKPGKRQLMEIDKGIKLVSIFLWYTSKCLVEHI